MEFKDEALKAIAEKAIIRKTGARGLRAIIEKAMTDIMFELPSVENAKKCIITEAVIKDGVKPKIILSEQETA